MQSREWVCQVANSGRLPGQVHREFDDVIRGLAGKKVEIKVGAYRKKRSTNQNAFYWGVVIPAVTQMFRDEGNYVDDEDTHEFLKLRVGKLAQVIVLPDGEVVKGLGSTKRLTTQEFEIYMDKIRAWAAEFRCAIPLPNEEEA